MQRFWSVLAIVVMSWPSVSSAFTLEFSAEQTVRKGAQSMRGKIYFQPDRWRVEMASPDGPKVALAGRNAVAPLLRLFLAPLPPGRR